MDEASLEIGTVVSDRYTVEELVGVGGLAEVYKVRHLELGSPHALKLLTWNRKSLTERLLLEGRIQAQLTHPHIVRVTDVLRIDSRVGLLLEFIEGPSLDDFLHHHGALRVPDALGLFAPVLAAVAHAHDSGVLHRDLKPANVLLMRAPGGWIPKVADFGLAKVVEEGLGPNTRTGISMGTPGYMPPEQVRNSASADVRTDIFALGSLVYEMIAGRKAFAPPDGGDIELTATIDRTPQPLEDEAAALWPAIARALEPDREARYADARAFAKALGIDDHPALAASPDLVRVPLELDPSTYPSNPSNEPAKASNATALPPPEPERRTPGPFAVAAIVGSVALAVVVTALMTQPVLETRRAREAAKQAAASVKVPEPVVEPQAPAPPTPEPPQTLERPAAPTPAPVAPPEPRVIEIVATEPVPEAPEAAPPEEASEAAALTVAMPDDGSVEVPPDPPPEAPPPPLGPALPVGVYPGRADRRPFELRIKESGARVVADAAFFAGSNSIRVEKLEGTYDRETGMLRLASPTDAKIVFEGQRDGQVIEGSYMRSGKNALPWRVSMP